MGGVIILGVDEDRTNCTPTLPIAGMPPRRGVPEQITSICQTAVYPPLLPEISGPIPTGHAGGTVAMVVRVPESPEAARGLSRS